jgi:hypothetical protein
MFFNMTDTHYPLPYQDHLISSFKISHSYFSSLVTYPISLKYFYSPFPRDQVFGSLGTAFSHKWSSSSILHPSSIITTLQSIHWARLAQANPHTTIIIIISQDHDWYHNYHPYVTKYSNTHVIAHFLPNTLQYYEPTKSNNNDKPNLEPRALQILCVHHSLNQLNNQTYINILQQITTYLDIKDSYIKCAPPLTSQNILINKNKTWKNL